MTERKNYANPNIKNIFVLMLENRSFDHMLGFSGLNGTNVTPGSGGKTSVTGIPDGDPNVTKGGDIKQLTSDPGHNFLDVFQQMTGLDEGDWKPGPYPMLPPNLSGEGMPGNVSGFIKNWGSDKEENMKCYTPDQLPVMMALAENFAVCDMWFSSMPGPTWPNRLFLHAASTGGLDDSPSSDLIEKIMVEKFLLDTREQGFSFENGTIFDRMSADSYRLYGGGWKFPHFTSGSFPFVGSFPIVMSLKGIRSSDINSFNDFEDDLNGDYPWAFTFIEPNYGDLKYNEGGNSQHPLDGITNGELLIKETYEAIRNSELWEQSMLIITYDEHGGFYDRVTPPRAIPPGDKPTKTNIDPQKHHGFLYDQYGPRLPTIVVSPYTPANSIDHTVYDHTSVLSTMEIMLGIDPLTDRDATANDLTRLVSEPEVRPSPEKLPNPVPVTMQAGPSGKMYDENDTLDTGNIPGFLHVILKSELEAAQSDAEKREIFKRFSGLKTRGDVDAYLEEVIPKLSK